MTIPSLFNLYGKTCVITGGGGHICSALAKGIASFGAKVAILDLRLEKAQHISDEINNLPNQYAMPYQVDMSNKQHLIDVSLAIEDQLGPVQLLVNGAGINSATPFFDITEEDWDSVSNSQIKSTLFGCQVFGRTMVKNRCGSIVNITSASAGPPLSKAFSYSCSKAAIKNLTQNLAREWAMDNVRVNAIRPGFFPTDWNKKNFITKEREEKILGHTPMSRYGSPSELVGAVIWLFSDSSSFVTGAEIAIDGGFSCMTI